MYEKTYNFTSEYTKKYKPPFQKICCIDFHVKKQLFPNCYHVGYFNWSIAPCILQRMPSLKWRGTLINPMFFFKEVLDSFIYDILEIVNSSLETDIFPDALNAAALKPLLKKMLLTLHFWVTLGPLPICPLWVRVWKRQCLNSCMHSCIVRGSMKNFSLV